jgi:ATP-dependent Zn protease
MSELDSKNISLYPFFVIDEVLYTFEKTKASQKNPDGTTNLSQMIMVKGGTLTPFVVNGRNLDPHDPNRRILLEILKRYYQLPEDLSVEQTLNIAVNNNNLKSHSQLRTLVLLAYNTEIVKSMDSPNAKKVIQDEESKTSNRYQSSYKYGIIILIIVLILAFVYFMMRKRGTSVEVVV